MIKNNGINTKQKSNDKSILILTLIAVVGAMMSFFTTAVITWFEGASYFEPTSGLPFFVWAICFTVCVVPISVIINALIICINKKILN